jgi:porin
MAMVNFAVAWCLSAVGAGLLLLATAARADEAGSDAKTDAPKPTGFWERDRLTGDWGGARTRLEDAGIKFDATQTSDGLADLSGGKRTGATYQGETELDLDLDLDKLAGWTGATVHISGVTVLGRSVTGDHTGALYTASSIDADRGNRLYDLYLDQDIPGGLASLRIGQAGADEEFMVSKVATPFLNGTFGYPGLPSLDQPSGGPEYPLTTPMARLKLTPTDQWTVLLAAFNGDPTGNGFSPSDPALRDRSGTSFRTSDGVLGYAEAQYAVNQGPDAAGLPATYKLGLWAHSGRFDDQRTPGDRKLNGDFSVYAVVDQMLWRRPDTKDEGISVFARVMGAPGDRNLVDLYADTGVTLKGPFEGRGDDVVGLAVAYSRISDDVRVLNAALPQAAPGRPINNDEIDLEATYQFAVTPWWQLQPDLQYVVHPGGNLTDPTSVPRGAVKDAVVAGLRATILF